MATRKWDRLTPEERTQVKDALIVFFENERDTPIGVIAADEILNFFLQNAGGMLYNKGLQDAKKVMTQRLEEAQYDVDDLLEYT